MRRVASGTPRRWQRAVGRNLGGGIGLVLLAFVLVFAFGGTLLGVGSDPLQQDLRARLKPPGSVVETHTYWLGSDRLGRDVLSRVIHGTRTSLLTAFIGSSLAIVLGTTLGLTAAYFGGWWSTVVNRLVDIQHSVPLLVVAVAVLAVFNPSWWLVIGLLVVWAWVPFARIAWGSSLSVLAREFVMAARGLGSGPLRVMLRHVLPNIVTSLLVMWTFQFAYLIVVESSLSFLGVGIPPPTPSLGRMLRDASGIIDRASWLVLFPGLALVATVFAANLIGDWLSDKFSRK